MTTTTLDIPEDLQAHWTELACGFPRVAEVFPDCMREAQSVLSDEGIAAYIEHARFLGKMGRGAEPILIFLEEWPHVAQSGRRGSLARHHGIRAQDVEVAEQHAIVPFLQSLPVTARRLQTRELLRDYLAIALELMEQTTGSIHGIHQTFPSPGLPEMFKQAAALLGQLSLAGLKNWVDYGVRYYEDHPDRQIDYFSLQSADSRAVLQRERHGTLLVDNERKLNLYLRGLWHDDDMLIPYCSAFDELRKPIPYYDKLGIRLPDVYNDAQGVTGLDRYRATLAHIAAHRRWTTAIIADNLSPFQRMAAEFLEDSRVEYLAMREYPGLRRIFKALHPIPAEDACDPETTSTVRHRSGDAVARHTRCATSVQKCRHHRVRATLPSTDDMTSKTGTQDIADLAVSFITKTRLQSDNLAKTHFADTVIDYRDDNRQMWKFIEEGDEEEAFDEPRKIEPGEEVNALPPRHYPEWDYNNQSYRPDWVSVYEGLHPQGNAADIDRLLEKHAGLAKRLKKILDLLKPQDKVRIRYQEEGSELDLDVAIRSLIDFKSGAQPDPRINMSHRNDGRSIAVMVLLDLSESLNEKAAGSEQTILELSQEAVSLLGWAVEKLGDPFAIAGFHSNTRHEVRYLHIKGYSERWNDEVKGRLAAMEASYSTRMGAAMRHAAHYLEKQTADKKLMLILTDGQPADIDTKDGNLLIADARQAVKELDRQGIYSYCINLDPKADEYVADIFGRQYTIIDNVEQLPQKLPELFISLTK